MLKHLAQLNDEFKEIKKSKKDAKKMSDTIMKKSCNYFRVRICKCFNLNKF